MSISSDEVNYLIYRYLQENGFTHSAFTFGYESLVTKSSVAQVDVPPGALITFIQKGLEYVGIEEHINEDGSVRDYDSNFSLLSPFICDAVAIKEDRKQRKPAASTTSASGQSGSNYAQTAGTAGSAGGVAHAPPTPNSTNRLNEVAKQQIPPAEVRLQKDSHGVKYLQLGGHHGEVFMCSWNPNNSSNLDPSKMSESSRKQFHQLATGSADGICRLWGLQDVSSDIWDVNSAPNSAVHNISLHTGILPHATFIGEKMKDVTSISWSADGKFLATGCYDGLARVWNCSTGELKFMLKEHRESIFSVKWNKHSNHILTVSHDKRAIVWDSVTGTIVRIFERIHANAILDADWKDIDIFATCSTDTNISICSLSTPNLDVVAVLKGHTDEINAITWSPGGQFLASCSDDTTAKVWVLDPIGQETSPVTAPGQRSGHMKFNLTGHTKEIYTTRWTPTGKYSANPDLALYLCTASFDGYVKVWSMDTGLAVFSLCSSNVSLSLDDVVMPPPGSPSGSGGGASAVSTTTGNSSSVRTHPLQPIYSVSSSPNGKYLAIGSQGGYVSIFELATGHMVVEEQGLGDTFDVSWSFDGELLSACFASGLVNIMNVKNLLSGSSISNANSSSNSISDAGMTTIEEGDNSNNNAMELATQSDENKPANTTATTAVTTEFVSPVKVEKQHGTVLASASDAAEGERKIEEKEGEKKADVITAVTSAAAATAMDIPSALTSDRNSNNENAMEEE